MTEFFFVYIIKSLSTGKHYIGHTHNLTDRIKRHNENRSDYTKNKGPWELVISYPCNSKKEAAQLEFKLKKFKNYRKAILYLNKLAQG